MPQSSLRVASKYNKHSKEEAVVYPYHDLNNVRNRPAAGLSYSVRNSFQTERIVESGIGVVGWNFIQNGLIYTCRIKDENNNDVYSFGIKVPKGQEYLRRSSTSKLSIAEKAHILTIVEQCMSDNEKVQHRAALFHLEEACFDTRLGVSEEGPKANQTAPVLPGFIVGYCGFSFANDKVSLETLINEKSLKFPEPQVLFLEWDIDGKSYSIDCSDRIPRFQIGYVANPNTGTINMTQLEAKSAIAYARAKIDYTDIDLSRLCGVTGLWNKLEIMAGILPTERQPSQP